VFRINNDQAGAALWVALGALIAISSIRYGLGTLDSPGTGFMPFLAGIVITLFASIGLVHATLKQREGIGWKPTMQGRFWKKALIVLVALFTYVLILKPLGFFLGTTLFIGFLLRAVQPQRWSVVVAGAIATAFGAFGIFEIWLKAQLPRGPWGF
jgi:putative tricarboxylic transport membrane protein